MLHPVVAALDRRHLGLQAHDRAELLGERHRDAVHAADRLEHGGLEVEALLEHHGAPHVDVEQRAERHRIAPLAGLLARRRQALVAGARRALEGEVGREVAIGAQEGEHALLVAGVELLVERAAIDRLAEQFRDLAAHVVVGLAHLDRLAAVRRRIVEPRVAAGVDLDLERDAELPAIAEHGLVGARNAGRAGIPVHLRIELADLPGAVGHLDAGAAPDAPVAPADAVARLEHRAVVAGLAELMGRRQPGDAGAEDDDLGAVGLALLQRQRLRHRRRAQQAHRLHRKVGRPVAADAADLAQEVPTRAAHLDPRNR